MSKITSKSEESTSDSRQSIIFKKPNSRWWNQPISALNPRPPVAVTDNVSIQEAVNIMKPHAYNQLPVIGSDGTLKGMVYLSNLIGKLLNGMVKPTDPVSRAIFKQFVKVNRECCVGKAARILEKDPFVLIVDSEKIRKLRVGVG